MVCPTFGWNFSTRINWLFKKLTNSACPWSLLDFGGQWPYASLFDTKPWRKGSMACWPRGNAAGGFSLLAVTFVAGWPPNMWRKSLKDGNINMPKYLSARSFITYTLILGNFMGITRFLQGGHFISHQLWSLWWVTLFLMMMVEIRLIKRRWIETL